MIAPTVYGSALPGSTLELQQLEEDLFLAGFRYDSESPFQPDDWLCLHNDCGRLPMFALYAADDFSREKGGISILGGKAYEDWSRMAEAWFWLRYEYLSGMPGDEALVKLKKTEDCFRRDDWDESVEELLENCIAILTGLEPVHPTPGEQMRETRESRDYMAFERVLKTIADTFLWDACRSAKYLAVLRQDLQVWQEWNS
ncbi:MAG: hypothetical protein Q4C54_07335 [Clostridia bacterium]|nr:hypothetical protein [Clostridia bacterium]